MQTAGRGGSACVTLKPQLARGLARSGEQQNESQPSEEDRVSHIQQLERQAQRESDPPVGGVSGYRPSPIPPSRCPALPLSLPGCGRGALGPPRSARPLAICCSRGTSTAVSHDSDCRSPGRSSSLAVARSLQGGAGAREGWGAQASAGVSPTSEASPSAPHLPSPPTLAPEPSLWQPGHTSSNHSFTHALNAHSLVLIPK